MRTDDTQTLEDVALEVVTSVFGEAIARHSKSAVIMVRFIRMDLDPEELMPYTALMSEFRLLARLGLARMEISDGSGGTKVREREPA